MQPRVNIYGFPHKGLRHALGKLSFELGQINIEDPEKLQELQSKAHEISELLSLHLHSEESHVLPPLEAKVPGSTTHNHEDHVAMEALEKKMVSDIDALCKEPNIPNSITAYNTTNMFIREYFRHMDEEENEMNQVIWSHFEDGDILGWQGKILSELTPEQFFKWFKYIIPALQPFEQNIMLGGFKENAPKEAFEATIENLKPFVTETQFNYIKTI